MFKILRSRSTASVVVSSALSVFLVAAVAQAATVINTSITTHDITADGAVAITETLGVTGASTLSSTLAVTGKAAFASAIYANSALGLDRNGGVLYIGNTLATSVSIASAASTTAVLGPLTVGGTLTVGSGGTAITKILKGSGTLTFPAFTGAGKTDCVGATSNITVTGATAGDPVFIGVPSAIATSSTYTNVTFFGWVDAANTVAVKACNHATSSTPTTISGATIYATVFN